MQQQSELPEGWALTNYGDVLSKIANGTTKKQNKECKGIPVTRIETISNGIIDLDRVGYIENIDEKNLEKYLLTDGDILLSHINSDIHLGKTAIYNSNHEFLLHGMNLLLLRPEKRIICPNYLHHLSVFYRISGEFISVAQHAVNQSSINQKILRNIQVHLPPLAEQHRIASAIEALFARLDATNERLDRVPDIVKRFRQSVLAAACDGRLTEGWREENPDVESAEELLIKFDQLHDSNLEKNSKSIIEFESDSKGLPDEWRWTKLGLICKIIMGQSPPGDSYNSIGNGTPLINGPVEFGPTAFSKTILAKYTSKPKKMCQTNDLLLCVRGSTTGRMNIAGFDACIGRGVAAIRSFAYQPYINNVIHAKEFEILNLGKGSTFPNINFENICNIPIPLPPLPEQHEIVRRVDALFALSDSIEAKVAAARERTEKLRQSILAKAFSGELVETEAELARREGRDYEPADVLLERIKAEQEKSGKKGKAA